MPPKYSKGVVSSEHHASKPKHHLQEAAARSQRTSILTAPHLAVFQCYCPACRAQPGWLRGAWRLCERHAVREDRQLRRLLRYKKCATVVLITCCAVLAEAMSSSGRWHQLCRVPCSCTTAADPCTHLAMAAAAAIAGLAPQQVWCVTRLTPCWCCLPCREELVLRGQGRQAVI